ncbi:MAG TPA: hypothetical protein VGB82_06135 [Alphaproteobacteria bacterium]
MAAKGRRSGHHNPAYVAVRGSQGPRREFKITVGLRAGYGPHGRIYDLEQAVRATDQWMIGRIRRGETFLTGMFTRGEILYARSPPHTDREPVAIFSGEALPLEARTLDDTTVEALLNELAAEMARTLEQEEVYIAYRDRTWTLRKSPSSAGRTASAVLGSRAHKRARP